MLVQLRKEDEDRPEAVTLFSTNKWQSPSGGWLSVQSGSWDQTPAGIGLNRTGENGGNVATLRGLNFFLNHEGDQGSCASPDQGGAGTWVVMPVADESAGLIRSLPRNILAETLNQWATGLGETGRRCAHRWRTGFCQWFGP